MNHRLIQITYTSILVSLAVFIWSNIYHAQFMPYDENYGALIGAFLASLVASLAILLLWWRGSRILEECRIITILFLVTSSAVTVGVVIFNYNSLFGHLQL